MPQLTENTPAQWESVIADLTTKQQAAREHIEQLRASKRDLALEAAMGGADAKKRLDKANNELARLTLESDDWDSAIATARSRLAEAQASVAAEAERARRAEMSALARVALGHAEEFSAALRHASSAGSQLKLTVRNMLNRASPSERAHIDRLLEFGPYMRAAEFAGLRAHLEFQGYTGLHEHIVSLEDSLAAYLSGWIEEKKEK